MKSDALETGFLYCVVFNDFLSCVKKKNEKSKVRV